MMGNAVKGKCILLGLAIAMCCMPIPCQANEGVKPVLAASAVSQAVEGGLAPVYGRELKDGVYEVEMESSSSMFRIVKAELTVAGGSMTAALTLSGTGYLKLFMGTGEEADKAGEESFIPYVEDAKGAYTYTIPIEALDREFSCAAYSRRKERWYDRQLMVLAASLPEDAFVEGQGAGKQDFVEGQGAGKQDFVEGQGARQQDAAGSGENVELKGDLAPAAMQVDDGAYTIEVDLSGGTGRASIASPAAIRVSGGEAIAAIEWSSSDYDYMIVNGTQYFPVNTEGNSKFEIPVLALDQGMDVVADTVAMSKPHEIAYTLTFHSDTMRKEGEGNGRTAEILAAAVLAVVGILVVCRVKKKKGLA